VACSLGGALLSGTTDCLDSQTDVSVRSGVASIRVSPIHTYGSLGGTFGDPTSKTSLGPRLLGNHLHEPLLAVSGEID
jgi:hypothetical protein